MKKFLLLLVACLIMTPHLLHAQETDDVKTVNFLMKTPTSTLYCNKNRATENYIFGAGGIYNVSNNTINPYFSALGTTAVTGISIFRQYLPTDNDILFAISGNATTSSAGTLMKYNYTSSGTDTGTTAPISITVAKQDSITFRLLHGDIVEVQLVCNQSQTSYYMSTPSTNCTYGSTPISTSQRLITLTPKKNYNYVTFWYYGSGSGEYIIRNIVVKYRPKADHATTISAPSIEVNKTAQGVEYDEEQDLYTFVAQPTNAISIAPSEWGQYLYRKTQTGETPPALPTLTKATSGLWDYTATKISTWTRFATKTISPTAPTATDFNGPTYYLHYTASNELLGFAAPVNHIKYRYRKLKSPEVNIALTETANGSKVVKNEDGTWTVKYFGDNPKIFLTCPDPVTRYKYNEDMSTPDENSLTYSSNNGIAPKIKIFDDQEIAPGQTNYVTVIAQLQGSEGSSVYNTSDAVSIILQKDGEGVTKTMGIPNINIATEGAKTVELAGGVIGFIDDKITLTATPGTISGQTEHGVLEYQDFNYWAQNPSSAEGAWKVIPKEGIPISTNTRLFVREYLDGYAAPYTYKDFRNIETTPITKVEELSPEKLKEISDGTPVSLSKLKLWVRGAYESTNQTPTGKDVQHIMFVSTDKDDKGNSYALRITGDYTNTEDGMKQFFNPESNNIYIDQAVGVLQGQKNGIPELYVTTSTVDYTKLLGNKKTDETNTAPALEETNTLNQSDYSKLMLFSNMTCLSTGDNEEDAIFRDVDGNTFQTFHRIGSKTDYVDVVGSLDPNIAYRVLGYVGSADGKLVILPLAAVAGPRLLAPNAINPKAAPGEYIEMNVISPYLDITLNLTGVDEDEDIIQFAFGDTNATNWEEWVSNLKWNEAKEWTEASQIADVQESQVFRMPANGTIRVNEQELADGGCTLAVRLVSDFGLASGVVTVRFDKPETITTVNSIADFKKNFDDHSELPDLDANINAKTHEFYQLTPDTDGKYGYARVRAVTEHYLYLRTTAGDGKNLQYSNNQELSDQSILLYNANGWKQNVAAIRVEGLPDPKEIDERTRPLEAGDVITNFALIPTRSSYGNLIGNATGFIRTFRRIINAEGGSNSPIVINAQNTDENGNILYTDENGESKIFSGFTDADRMLRFTIENVYVKKKFIAKNDPGEIMMLSDDIQDEEESGEFYYALDFGKDEGVNSLPETILQNGVVFDAINGWDIAQDDNTPFNVSGILMLANGNTTEGDPGRYMLALQSYEVANDITANPPVISIVGAGTDNENQTFITKAQVVITTDDPEDFEYQTHIYYTTDGTDPRTSETAEPYTSGKEIDITSTNVIKAYVLAKGARNSELSEALFTRTGIESRYILNFLTSAEDEKNYHLTANVRVAAKGGDYLFVRGTQGHYLPINIEDNCLDTAKIHVGDYLNDMVITPHVILPGTEKETIRGAHITPAIKDLFVYGSATKPESLADPILFEPDEVTTITSANARRFVKITGVSLEGFKIEVEDPDIATQDADKWILHTDKGDGDEIRVNHTVLKPEFDFDKVNPLAFYNITGFAMLGNDGIIELWPTKVEEVATTLPVKATVTGNIISKIEFKGTPEAPTYDQDVTFYPYTTVELTPTGASSATIYYYFAEDNKDISDNEVKWTLYGQKFAITKSGRLHAKAIREGYEESVHTHIDFTLGESNSAIEFNLHQEQGKTIMTLITQIAGAEIYYTENKTLPLASWTRYSSPVQFTDDTEVWAYAKKGSDISSIASQLVKVYGGSSMSGRLVISHKLNETDGKYLITIAPENQSLAAGSYDIHYTTDGSTPTTASPKYSGPFEMPKTGGIVLAILKEASKQYPGEVAHLNISYIPTGIDGIDSDRDDSDAIRTEGGNIIAPEGSEVYDINGRRVATTALRSGIYIVRTPEGKAVKVKVD